MLLLPRRHPTSSYLKMLYKYPQAEFPYDDLVATNGGRGLHGPEYDRTNAGAVRELLLDRGGDYARWPGRGRSPTPGCSAVTRTGVARSGCQST